MPSTLPPYRAYTVRKSNDENKKDVWITIGAAWPHRDEKGIDVILDALPLEAMLCCALTNRAPRIRATTARPCAALSTNPIGARAAAAAQVAEAGSAHNQDARPNGT